MTAIVLALGTWVCLMGARFPSAQDAGPKVTAAGPAAPDPRLAEDPRARAAWSTLTSAEQRDAVDYFALEASHLETFQMSLVRFVLGTQDKNPMMWPEAQPAPVFDEKEHAPAQPIQRHELDANSESVRHLVKTVFAGVPARALHSAWTYDYGARELRRSADVKDPARIFRNGLAGFPPDLDLCEALVERALDDGSQQKILQAFGHAYTDRAGGVFPGVTLYDTWASGAEVEMPDVDTLGIVHTVLGDWKTWRAPVTQQESLYGKLGELYLAGHRHRGLREALARTYLVGAAVLRDQYQPILDNFHALWDAHHSAPEELLPKLPPPDKLADFFAGWAKECHAKGELYQAGIHRRQTLEQDSAAVRSLMLRVLQEFEGFDRIEKKITKPDEASSK